MLQVSACSIPCAYADYNASYQVESPKLEKHLMQQSTGSIDCSTYTATCKPRRHCITTSPTCTLNLLCNQSRLPSATFQTQATPKCVQVCKSSNRAEWHLEPNTNPIFKLCNQHGTQCVCHVYT